MSIINIPARARMQTLDHEIWGYSPASDIFVSSRGRYVKHDQTIENSHIDDLDYLLTERRKGKKLRSWTFKKLMEDAGLDIPVNEEDYPKKTKPCWYMGMLFASKQEVLDNYYDGSKMNYDNRKDKSLTKLVFVDRKEYDKLKHEH